MTKEAGPTPWTFQPSQEQELPQQLIDSFKADGLKMPPPFDVNFLADVYRAREAGDQTGLEELANVYAEIEPGIFRRLAPWLKCLREVVPMPPPNNGRVPVSALVVHSGSKRADR